MGLFGFIGRVVTLPIKVASAPVRIAERAFTAPDTDDELKPFTNASKKTTKTIEDVFDEMDED